LITNVAERTSSTLFNDVAQPRAVPIIRATIAIGNGPILTKTMK